MVGAKVYPTPASITLIEVTIPAELIIDTAIAVVPIPGELIVTRGGEVYPDPPFVIVIIPIIPLEISVVAATPIPPPPTKLTPGATEYPYPGLVISTP